METINTTATVALSASTIAFLVIAKFVLMSKLLRTPAGKALRTFVSNSVRQLNKSWTQLTYNPYASPKQKRVASYVMVGVHYVFSFHFFLGYLVFTSILLTYGTTQSLLQQLGTVAAMIGMIVLAVIYKNLGHQMLKSLR